MKKLSVCAGLILLAVTCYATELKTVVEMAIDRHAAPQAAAALAEEAAAGLRATQWARWPRLSARVEALRGDNPVYVFGSLLTQGRFGPSNFAISALNHPAYLSNIRSALDLTIPLFTGFELSTQAKLAELARERALSQREAELQRLRLETAGLVLKWKFLEAQGEILEARLQSARGEIASAERLRARGLVLGSDFYAAQAIDGMLAAWKNQVGAERAATQARLTVLLGDAPPTLTGTMAEASYVLPERAELVRQALLHQPGLRAAKSGAQAAAELATQESRSLYPKVQGFASIETNTDDFESNPSNRTIGVAAQLPFGDPSYLARADAKKSGRRAAELSAAAASDQVEQEIVAAYEEFMGVVNAVPILKQTAAQADRALESFRPLYRSGRQSIIDVMRAEEASARAQIAYQEALFHLHTGYLRLMAAAGLLDESAVATVSNLAVRP